MTLVSDFDFHLPPELVAQEAPPRGASRLLVVHRESSSFEERALADLPGLLAPGDLVVANDTKVFPARLIGRRDPSGGAAECLLLAEVTPGEWEALVHPGQKLKPGARLIFEDGPRAPGVRIVAQILERASFGRRRLALTASGADTLETAIDALGHVPLPPYIHRSDRVDDRDRYQTIYAAARGSIAAPTAGLHFTDEMVRSLAGAGVGWATVTLHVGYGTFKPVRVDEVSAHRVDAERFEITDATAAAIAETRARGKRVVAVGTTTTRALETAAKADGRAAAGSGRTELFIHPGHRFAVVDALFTNFHLPKSSLLMLVAAFGGTSLVLDAYRFAVDRGFRFYSYGDAMLIV